MTLLMRIFAVVKPAVRVDLSPGYSIVSPPTVNPVRSCSSLWSLMSYTNDPYVTLRPLEMFDLRIDLIVFVLYILLIAFGVDRIHLILYLNCVMSSWCLSDLPVSGHITAFAISGIMMTCSFLMAFSLVLALGLVGNEKQ
jgi:hypothetical protein